MRLAALAVLLLGCGPVMLGAERASSRDGGLAGGASPTLADAAPSDGMIAAAAGSLGVDVAVKSIDCGRCFELAATGSGGRPPYEYEWEDGSSRTTRRVCVDAQPALLSVVVRDAASARSAAQTIRLEGLDDAGCPTMPPAPPQLCLQNGSFEGTPAANFGLPDGFDAAPWNTCTNPSAPNTPDVVNDTIPQSIATVPQPTEGTTFLALGEDEQVSQTVCEPIRAGVPFMIALDLSRIDIGAGVVPETEQVFLEIWGGLSVDCSQRELLWASPALQVGWKHFCMELKPGQYMDRLTLRANSDKSLPSPAYLLADDLAQVDHCP